MASTDEPPQAPIAEIIDRVADEAVELVDRRVRELARDAAARLDQARLTTVGGGERAGELRGSGWLTDHLEDAVYLTAIHRIREAITDRLDDAGYQALQQALASAREQKRTQLDAAIDLGSVMRLGRYGVTRGFGRRPGNARGKQRQNRQSGQ